MTKAELQSRLSLYFENDTYYTGQDLTDSIQDGYDEVAAFSGCILKATVLAFQANLTYYDMTTLIADYMAIYAIFNTVTKRWMIPISLRKLDNERIDWETAAGTPYYFCPVNTRYVAIYKKPTTTYGDMYVFYKAIAPTAQPGDTLLIPNDHLHVLKNYSYMDLLEQNQEFTKAGIKLKEYIESLDGLRQYVQNQRIPDRLSSLK